MAIYDAGTASLAADGTVTGVGTTWKAPLTLIRVGATIVFKTEPVKIYTISEIISDTQVNVYNPNSETVPAGTGYAILAHDGITVQGLAQDVAETLRYYQSRESEVATAVDIFKNFDQDKFSSDVNQVNTQYGEIVTIGNQVSSDAAQVTADKDAAASSAASASSDKDAAAASAQQAADYAASLDTQNLLRKDLALSDLTDKELARQNLDVYSKSQIDTTLTSGDSFGYLGAFNYAQLRSYSGSLNYVHVRGRSSAGDGGQGFFYRDNADTSSADNDGTVIVSESGVRWKRKFERLLDVRWFGLIGDGVFNNSPRFQSAVNWATQSGNKVTFYFPKGEFRFNSTVSTPGRYLFNMIGEGGLRDSSGTILKFYNDSSLTLRGSNVAGTSGPTYCNAFAEGIVFSGDNINSSSPVKLVDLVGFVFDKCTFTKCLYGINMLDEFYWTESCVARNCYFSNECNTALLMRVSSSNQYVSFYGSGLDNCFIENTGTGRQKIEIASRAQPYNSPLNVTIGHTPISGTPLISHAGNDNSWFVGNIRAEVGEEFDCELVSSKPLYIVGSLTSMGGKVKTEYAYFCDDVRVDVTSNTLNYRRKPFSRYVTLPANGGGPIFQYLPRGGNQTYDIYITTTASGYSYEQHVVMHTNYSNGTAGSVKVVETFRNYDSSSIGAPSIEYNAEATRAQLYLYRSGLPAGAIVYMDIHPRGTHVNKILG